MTVSGRKCILHIGVHKTGSTSIQKVLHKHRETLEDLGFYFPKNDSNYGQIVKLIYSRSPHLTRTQILRGLHNEELAKIARDNAVETLKADISARPDLDYIFSAEGLSTLGVNGVRDLAEMLRKHFTDFKVIAYVRRHADWTASAMQQNMKSGKTIAELVDERKTISYRQRIGPWLKLFPAEQLDIRDFSSAINSQPHGLVGDFCQAAGIPTAFLDGADLSSSNESHSAWGVHLLDALNRRRPMIRNKQRAPDRWRHDHRVFYPVTGPKFRAPEALLDANAETTAADEAWLKDKTGIAFPPAAPTTSETADIDPEFAEAVALAIADLQIELRQETIRSAILRSELAAANGDQERAIQLFERVVRLDPSSPKLMVRLISLCRDAGADDKAARHARTFVATFPDHAKAKQFKKDYDL